MARLGDVTAYQRPMVMTKEDKEKRDAAIAQACFTRRRLGNAMDKLERKHRIPKSRDVIAQAIIGKEQLLSQYRAELDEVRKLTTPEQRKASRRRQTWMYETGTRLNGEPLSDDDLFACLIKYEMLSDCDKGVAHITEHVLKWQARGEQGG